MQHGYVLENDGSFLSSGLFWYSENKDEGWMFTDDEIQKTIKPIVSEWEYKPILAHEAFYNNRNVVFTGKVINFKDL